MQTQTAPQVGDRYVDKFFGEFYQVVNVNLAIDAITLVAVMPAGATSFVVSMVHLINMYTPIGLQKSAIAVFDSARLPPGQSNEFFGVSLDNALNRCTCGVDSIGGGKHSAWCDKLYIGD